MQTFLDRYEEAIRRLPVVATSPKEWVTVQRSESGEVTVTLRRGVLGKVSESGLAAELQAALTEAYAYTARNAEGNAARSSATTTT